jgi:hypothetical protein
LFGLPARIGSVRTICGFSVLLDAVIVPAIDKFYKAEKVARFTPNARVA